MNSPTLSANDLVPLSDFQGQPLEWLWPGRIPIGKLTLIDGDPSQGKSLLSLDLAARLTSGREFPDGFVHPTSSVILVSVEDGVEDTLVPRLQAAGADRERVLLFRGQDRDKTGHRWPSFPEDCNLLREHIVRTKARLVVIDPLMAFLSPHIHAANDSKVRRALGPLAAMAEATRSAIVLIRHLNKSGSMQRAIYRGGGSIAIIAAARTAYLVGEDPDQPGLHVLACTKNNLAEKPSSLAYRIVAGPAGQPVLEWSGEVDIAADQLIVTGRPSGEALEQAVQFLDELLADGPRSHREIQQKARELNIAPRTLARAKGKRKIVSRRISQQGRLWWVWCLSQHEDKCEEMLSQRKERQIENEKQRLRAYLDQFGEDAGKMTKDE